MLNTVVVGWDGTIVAGTVNGPKTTKIKVKYENFTLGSTQRRI